jgi:hypothetical protein
MPDDGRSTAGPAFRSLAFRAMPAPDWAEVTCVAAAAGLTEDPRVWAEAVFDARSVPIWIKALFGLRQAVVGLIGISRAREDVFAVSDVEGDEALIVTRDRHLDFAAAVAYGTDPPLVRVTTAVVLHGWRGRAYFAPVKVLHGAVTRAMVRRAIDRISQASRR